MNRASSAGVRDPLRAPSPAASSSSSPARSLLQRSSRWRPLLGAGDDPGFARERVPPRRRRSRRTRSCSSSGSLASVRKSITDWRERSAVEQRQQRRASGARPAARPAASPRAGTPGSPPRRTPPRPAAGTPRRAGRRQPSPRTARPPAPTQGTRAPPPAPRATGPAPTPAAASRPAAIAGLGRRR